MRRRQVAALAHRFRADGTLEILVMTSRDSGRIVIPKGWPMAGRKRHEAAAIEAWEEAGVRGRIGKKPIGRYAYEKRDVRFARTVVVEVFPLRVEAQDDTFPEKGQRRLIWTLPDEAAGLVGEPDLAALIRAFADAAGVRAAGGAQV